MYLREEQITGMLPYMKESVPAPIFAILELLAHSLQETRRELKALEEAFYNKCDEDRGYDR